MGREGDREMGSRKMKRERERQMGGGGGEESCGEKR